MKSFSQFAIVCVFVAACSFCAPSAAAQVGPVVMSKEASQKPVWLKVKVVRFDQNSMTVRVVGNENRILTFTYAATAEPQVHKALHKGGYQHGADIKIRYIPGTSMVLKIHGKASKSNPSNPHKPTSPLRLHPTPDVQQ
jgi:hypothetical protein